MRAETSRPEFEFRPVIELPDTFPVACFLTGSKGEDILNEFKARAKTKYQSADSLSVLAYKGGVVQGSNPFSAVLVGEIMREDSQGLRIATPADIEKTLRAGDILGIRGNYCIDTALVLRSEIDSCQPNDPLSRELYTQLNDRLGRKLKLPVMIPLRGLDLRVDGSNSYGLGFVLREDAEVIRDPVLNEQRRFNTEDVNTETGLPKKTRAQGSRRLYTRDAGLSGLVLSRDLLLYADWYYLGSSDADGRVALCGKATRENFYARL